MANIKSAIKRIDRTKKETLRNKSVKTGIKTSIRKFEEALDKGISTKREISSALSTKNSRERHPRMLFIKTRPIVA